MNEQSDIEPAEVVEQLENELLDLAVVKWVAGDSEPSTEQKQRWLRQLQETQGENFYSNLLFTLTGQRYKQDKAIELWKEINLHRDELTATLGRSPGIVVATLDYMTNCQNNDIEFRLIESKKLEDMLERAVADSLTGLYDHDTLLALLENELERAIRHNHPLSFVLMDLDDFKRVNDTHGHQKGDEVLIRLAEIIENSSRVIDIAGRYGGEEFSLILPETSKLEATHIAERLRKTVQDAFRNDLQLTISIGISTFPTDGNHIEKLVKLADNALYKAKKKGKNCIVTT